MMDTVYPEPLSRIHRRAVRKKFHKNSARYRTQPVTFAEIQLWGSAFLSNIDILERFQSKLLRLLAGAPWFVLKNIIRDDLGVPTEVDEEQINDDCQNVSNASKSDLDLKAKFEEFKRQRDRDLYECRLASNKIDTEVVIGSNNYEKSACSKENEARESQGLHTNLPSILPYRGSTSCPRTSV